MADGSPDGKVGLGQVSAGRAVTRADVAAAADALLARSDTWGWVDVVGGDEQIEKAAERIGTTQPHIDAIDGEDLDRIYALK